MKIGLIDVDGHNFPNYALMKISAYHKSIGDTVEWANPLFGKYDLVYKSKVFAFTPDNRDIYDCQVLKGGTGYDINSNLPDYIDNMQPDYSLYGIHNTSYGFLTRGCHNKCKWCIVPLKEGAVRPYRDIEEITNGNKKAILMDNNILASEYGIIQLEKIAKLGIRVDFNQGLDARLITDDIAKILSKIKWIDYIRLACDQKSQISHLIKAHDLLGKYGYKKDVFCYFLINDFDDANYRLESLRKYRWFVPHGQPYRDFNNHKQIIPQWQKDMAHWMNRRWLYRSCEFKDYEPRKGFKCIEYINNNELLK